MIANPTTSWTELADASAAMSARCGRLGTTTVKPMTHTATHDRPAHGGPTLYRLGYRYCVAAIPKLPATSKTRPVPRTVATGIRRLRGHAATSSAVIIDPPYGPHWSGSAANGGG